MAVDAVSTEPHTLTAREYVDAFATWRRLSAAKFPRRRQDVDHAAASARFDALVSVGCTLVLAAFPDDERREPDTYCAVFAAFLGDRPTEDGEGVRDLELAIRKSCLLSRLIYHGDKPRTRPCPRHHGRWSGIVWPGRPCPHDNPECPCPLGCACIAACGCATGWLPDEPELP